MSKPTRVWATITAVLTAGSFTAFGFECWTNDQRWIGEGVLAAIAAAITGCVTIGLQANTEGRTAYEKKYRP